jgi:hypothetical protein
VLYEDGRPYTVPDSLEELTGPTSGVVELPQRLDWSEQGRYDLSDPRQRNLMYEGNAKFALSTSIILSHYRRGDSPQHAGNLRWSAA